MRHGVEELVHCETIVSRSRRYDWEIAAHRHPSLCQLLVMVEGTCDILLDDAWSYRSGPVLVVTPAGVVHGFRFSSEAEGHVLTLSEKFVTAFADDAAITELLSHPRMMALTDEHASRLSVIAAQTMLAATGGADSELVRRALAEAFVRIVAGSRVDPAATPKDPLVQQFQRLAGQHLREQRRLAFYADALGCTERTLSRRVQNALGVSPGHYLGDRLCAEATRLLRFTNATCSDVADELGFIDPSYFSRFYARMTGRRPSAVRGSEG